MDGLTTQYFKRFHCGCIDSIRENLESDTWEIVPVAPDFQRSVLTLQIPVKEGSDAVSMGMTSINIRPAFEIDLGRTTNSCATSSSSAPSPSGTYSCSLHPSNLSTLHNGSI
jgi:hypothetical protein